MGAPLAAAAAAGHSNICQLLLQAHGELNAYDRRAATPLMLASGRGHLEVVRFLAGEALADVGRVDRRGRSALTHAFNAMLALPPAAADAGRRSPLALAPVEMWTSVGR